MAKNVNIFSEVLPLPKELEEHPVGIALDIGGSLTKLLYKDKDVDQSPRLKVALISNETSGTIIDYIQKHADIGRTAWGKEEVESDAVTCFTTGIRTKQFAKDIEKHLRIRCVNENEFECMGLGFKYMAENLAPDQFFYPLQRNVCQTVYERQKTFALARNQLCITTEDKQNRGNNTALKCSSFDDIYSTYCDENVVYPCILVICGSAYVIYKINADGEIEWTWNDFCARGGRTFLGLGALLTGAKSYEDLINLAKNGDSRNLDTLMKDLEPKDQEAGAYSVVPDDVLCYHFGNAMSSDKDQFNKEDIAAGLLTLTCSDLIQFVTLFSKTTDIRHVYFGGSFMNSEVVRREITYRFMLKHLQLNVRGSGLQMRMLRVGAHLGVVGAWLKGLKNNNNDNITKKQDIKYAM